MNREQTQVNLPYRILGNLPVSNSLTTKIVYSCKVGQQNPLPNLKRKSATVQTHDPSHDT